MFVKSAFLGNKIYSQIFKVHFIAFQNVDKVGTVSEQSSGIFIQIFFYIYFNHIYLKHLNKINVNSKSD